MYFTTADADEDVDEDDMEDVDEDDKQDVAEDDKEDDAKDDDEDDDEDEDEDDDDDEGRKTNYYEDRLLCYNYYRKRHMANDRRIDVIAVLELPKWELLCAIMWQRLQGPLSREISLFYYMNVKEPNSPIHFGWAKSWS